MTVFSRVEEAIEEIRHGRILVVVDDEDRENEGDLVMAADKVTPEAVNFMARYGRGLICVPMTGERLDELKISMMVSDNTAPMGTAFTVTVDARRGVTTGTSAYDRAVTIRTLVDPQMGAEDLTRPGHILPLRAMPGAHRFAVVMTEYEARNFSLVDVLHPACSKGAALAEWATLRGLERKDVMAIGDNLNDREMLEYAGLPVVMGNSVPELKRLGWRVTLSNDQNGVAAAIEAYALGPT